MSREHELFQLGLEDAHTGQNPYHRHPVEASTQAALEILENTNIRRLAAVLNSRRRVNAIMDGVGIISPLKFNDDHLFYRVPDVHFDLKSFTGMELSPTQIEYYYRTIRAFETAFSNLALVNLRLLPLEIKGRAVNNGELEVAAKTWVERAIWDRWTPEGENALKIAVSLKRTIVNSFYHFPSFVKAYTNGERPRHGRFLLNGRLPHHGPLAEALDKWYTDVSDLRIWQVFYLIENLDPRLKRALLDRFGYLHPGEQSEERLARYQISRNALRGDFIRAVREVLGAISSSYLTGREFPSHDIALIVKKTEESPIYRMNGRVLHHDSPRILLLRSKDNPALMEKLNLAEKRLFNLATQMEGNEFINSDEVIAKKMGLSPDSIVCLLKRTATIILNRERRLFFKDGLAINPDSSRHYLIVMRGYCSPEQLTALCSWQREALDQLTTPDKNGQYQSTIEVARNLGRKVETKRIINALENFDWVVSLRERIEQALRSGKRFNSDEVEIMEYILEGIREGRPLRSKNSRGVCWTAICRTLHKHLNRGNFLSQKLKRLGN